MNDETILIDSTKLDASPKAVYEYFVLSQPNIDVRGLFKKDYMYYIVCNGINENTLAYDGTNIWEWFRNNKILGAPIELIDLVPKGSERLRERKVQEIIESGGAGKNLRNLLSNLLISLPRDFPKIDISSGERMNINVKVERLLRHNELQILEDILLKQEVPVTYRVIVDKSISNGEKNYRDDFRKSNIDIIPAKLVSNKVSKDLLRLIEEDEDLWRDNRNKIFTGEINNQAGILPEEWDKLESRCFINASVFPQINIRNYLSIYEKIIMVFPLENSKSRVLASLNISEDELIRLAELKRIGFILPQSIDRYPIGLVEEIALSAPESLIFSRRMASMTMINSRNRFPFLYPPIKLTEKVEIIKTLYNYASKNQTKDSKILMKIIAELARIWSASEDQINYQGAMGTGSLGLGKLMATLAGELVGEEDMGFLFAANTVEWAAPFHANIGPNYSEDGYTDEAYIKILANAYSSINSYDHSVISKLNNYILDGIFTVDSDVPVIDFAKTFESGDITRLRNLIFKISNNCDDFDDATETIRKFNKDIINYESRAGKLGEWEISGFLQVALSVALSSVKKRNPNINIPQASIPLAIWLMNVLNNKRSTSEVLSTALDSLEGVLQATEPDTILVARMRKNYKRI